MSAHEELIARERRAQTGVLQFAEEMQAIRDERLYPHAGQKDAWKTYCQDRWGMSQGSVARTIRAMPVLRRLSVDGVNTVPVSAADAVAALAEPVQDAILGDSPKRDLVRARAKKARQIVKRAGNQGVEPDEREVIREAMQARPKPKSKPVAVPPELQDENLPPKLTPQDHGWAPRKLAGDGLLAIWRANQKLQDQTPPSDDDRDETDAKLEKIIALARAMQATLRGEGFVSDADLSALMEGRAS